MIPIFDTKSGIYKSKLLLNFCVGEFVDGRSPEVSRVFSKYPLLNLGHCDTNLMGAADCGYMVLTNKLPKN